MTAFIVRVVFMVVFLIGLGAIAEKVNLIFQPEEKEEINFTEFHPPDIKMSEELPAPDVKVVKLDKPRKIIIQRLPNETAHEVRMKIGPIIPPQFEDKIHVIREDRSAE